MDGGLFVLPTAVGPVRVRIAPRQFVIVHDGMLWVVRRMLAVRPNTAMVVAGGGVLQVRFGRWRLCSSLRNIAAVTTGQPCARESALGMRLSPHDRGVIIGCGRWSRDDAGCDGVGEDPEMVRVRFRRPVSMVGPVILRCRWVVVSTTDSAGLVAALTVSANPVRWPVPGTAAKPHSIRRSTDDLVATN